MGGCTISAEIVNDNKRSNRTESILDVIVRLLCPRNMLCYRARED